VGRVVAVLLIAAGVVSACGSSSRGTIDSLLKRPGPDVAVTTGAGSFVPGLVRFPFLVIDSSGKPVERPSARVWVATGRDARPFASTTARLEPVGVPGRSAAAAGHVTKIYVARFRIPRPGRYWLVAVPDGARVQAVSVFEVDASVPVPKVGAKAPASATPTLGSEPIAALTTDVPPDRDLLRRSVAGSLAAHEPFVVTFATPRFCTSRVCGPVVDVVQSVARRFSGSGIRFIHVEVYRDNDPTKGYNRWMRQWGLTTEPWTFLVGRDGRIKSEFEGSVSADELTRAVRAHLAP
jgi:hypothetical protein